MASFARGFQVGAGLLGLGYGIYRLTQGRRDWVTTSAITSGLSMALAAMGGNRTRSLAKSIRFLVNTVGARANMFRRPVMRMTPAFLANAGTAVMQAFR